MDWFEQVEGNNYFILNECNLNYETKYGTITWINKTLAAIREELQDIFNSLFLVGELFFASQSNNHLRVLEKKSSFNLL